MAASNRSLIWAISKRQHDYGHLVFDGGVNLQKKHGLFQIFLGFWVNRMTVSLLTDCADANAYPRCRIGN
jgi:hypothetical protein